MSFTWFNINPGYQNQLVRYSSDGGKTFTDISFPAGVWNYTDINAHIKKATAQGKDEWETTFRVTIALKTGYQLGMTVSNFPDLLGFNKQILTNS